MLNLRLNEILCPACNSAISPPLGWFPPEEHMAIRSEIEGLEAKIKVLEGQLADATVPENKFYEQIQDLRKSYKIHAQMAYNAADRAVKAEIASKDLIVQNEALHITESKLRAAVETSLATIKRRTKRADVAEDKLAKIAICVERGEFEEIEQLISSKD